MLQKVSSALRSKRIYSYHPIQHRQHFLGGFLSQSWESSGGCIKDPRAFLFTLSYNGVRKPRKFPVTKPNQAAYAHNNLGPTFGKVEIENLPCAGYQYYNAEPFLSTPNLLIVVQKSLSQLFLKIFS